MATTMHNNSYHYSYNVGIYHVIETMKYAAGKKRSQFGRVERLRKIVSSKP